MDQTLEQLGRLLLGSVPTIVFLLLLYWIYVPLLHKPLLQALAERRRRTEGALETAKADIAAAEERTSLYEQRLREARASLFKAQEVRLENAAQARAATAAEARARAQAQVEEARTGIEKDKVAAQSGLQSESARLAQQIIQTILRPAAVAD
jgi:F-type H+-transporting ATPase subunit b